MTVINCNYFSYVLGMSMPLTILMPQRPPIGGAKNGAGTQDGCPVLYLLHGLTEDETYWSRLTGIERLASLYGIAVVMPRADRSFYANMKYGLHYWTCLSRELPKFIGETFRFATDRKHTFAAGNSMGGFGALKLAFNCPGRFSAIGAFSPVIQPDPPLSGTTDYIHTDRDFIYGGIGGSVGTIDDLMQISNSAAAHRIECPVPRIWQACGTEDSLIESNRMFAKHLDHLGLEHEFHVMPGAHDWSFWDSCLPSFFQFLNLEPLK